MVRDTKLAYLGHQDNKKIPHVPPGLPYYWIHIVDFNAYCGGIFYFFMFCYEAVLFVYT